MEVGGTGEIFQGEGSGGQGGGKRGARGREMGIRGREAGVGDLPVHPHIYNSSLFRHVSGIYSK